MFASLSASRKILFAFSAIGAVSILAGGLILWSMIAVGRSGDEVGARLAPLVDAAMEIKLHGAEAYIALEAAMAGGGGEDILEVQSAIDNAQFYAEAILFGAENEEGVFLASDDVDVRDDIQRVSAGLQDLRIAAEARHGLLGARTGVGSDADAEFDGLYDDLTDRIAAATDEVGMVHVQRLAGDARYLLAHGHLLVAEILGGDLGEDFGEATGSFDAAMERLREVAALAPVLAETLEPILSDMERLRTLAVQRYDRTLELSRSFEDAEGAFAEKYESFVRVTDAAETRIQENMQRGLVQQRETKDRAKLLAAFAAALVLVMMIGFQRWLDRSIGSRMTIIAGAMERLTSGDLDVSPPDWGTSDEIGLLREKLEDLRQAFMRQKELERTVLEEREEAQHRRAEAEKLGQEAERARIAAEEHRERAEVRARAADAFGKDFARVVEAAREGRFDMRIEMRTGEADLDRLSDALNEMLQSVGKGVDSTIEVMSAVAKGDLRRKMSGDFKGAFGEMQSSVNATLDELTRIATALLEMCAELTADVRHLAESSDRLSQRSTSQAASLEETNAAMTSMSSVVKSSEVDFSATLERVSEASRHARAGEAVVLQAIGAVERIDENARKVSEFISVIDEISFQTNLLALNAGVEAARAGEAGKGFAVVAQEVRALAQRANDAASGIGDLIEESGRGVEEGVRLVTQTGEVLRDILGSISQVSDFSTKIADSNRVQANGISEVSTVIADLDRLTQQNAAMAEEGTARSRKLQDRTESLQMLLDFFDLGMVSGRKEFARAS